MNKILLVASAACLALPVSAQRGFGSSAEVFPALAKKYDKNHDGKISAAEYPRGEKGFKNLDRDGDGTISEADFERSGSSRGGRSRGGRSSRNMGGMVAGSIAGRADSDEDGKVTKA